MSILMQVPKGGARPFYHKPTSITQLTLGPYAVHIWSRNTPESSPNKISVLHRVARAPLCLKMVDTQVCELEIRARLWNVGPGALGLSIRGNARRICSWGFRTGLADQTYLTQSVFKFVFQKSTPLQIRQLLLDFC